jgi:hypothetical protein
MSVDLLRTAYDGVRELLAGLDDTDSWTATGCLGWSVRDLTFHCTTDAQRALVALHTPAPGPADTDEVTYWRGWGSDPEGDAAGRRYSRVNASLFGRWEQLRDLHAETTLATVGAAGRADLPAVVSTQGHAITVGHLLSTLTVEATIHHLDLVEHLPGSPGPATAPLAEARRVLDLLAGTAFPRAWPDESVVRMATGRSRPTAEQAATLGHVAARLPLFS